MEYPARGVFALGLENIQDVLLKWKRENFAASLVGANHPP
jgi:hypothetical protein